jgi:hypothetical protein
VPSFADTANSLRISHLAEGGKRPQSYDLTAYITTSPQISHPRANSKTRRELTHEKNFDSSHTRKLG